MTADCVNHAGLARKVKRGEPVQREKAVRFGTRLPPQSLSGATVSRLPSPSSLARLPQLSPACRRTLTSDVAVAFAVAVDGPRSRLSELLSCEPANVVSSVADRRTGIEWQPLVSDHPVELETPSSDMFENVEFIKAHR
ncbi:hypothetical protein ACLOJK_040686 [Asimina triloba]